MEAKKNNIIFDPLYGFIKLSSLEWEIIHTPFYQRLRWIRQIGFSSYTFPGAEHSRFGHSIGVMFNAHMILKSIGKAVRDEDFFNDEIKTKEKTFQQEVRLGALLHDLGTFPFSHTTELSYITFGETTKQKDGKGHPDDHEHLGSFIIKNTDYDQGITKVLKKYNIKPQEISDLVKGISPNILANQILHSEVDCDRMDYLLRDAHYTGLKYGDYDRDYLLHHFTVSEVQGEEIFTIKQSALHCVEDFLMSRFAWYSQVVRSARGAKFDALAEELTLFLIKNNYIHTYSELLKMISSDPLKFYMFNDHYFMTTIHELFYSGKLDKDPKYKSITEALLFEKSPRTVRCEEFTQKILNQDDKNNYQKVMQKAKDKVKEIEQVIEKHGTSDDWIVTDLPKKHLLFVKSYKQVVKSTKIPNILLERDPAKILMDNGQIKLLSEVENSIIHSLQNKTNFVPYVFCSDSAHKLLKSKGIITE